MSFVFTYLFNFADPDTFCVPNHPLPPPPAKVSNINNRDKKVTNNLDSLFLSN